MPPLSDIATITVTTTGAGVTRQGYGVPLVVSHTAVWPERTRTYTSSAAVAVDFAVNTPEYLAANAIFSQSPSVSSIKVGRAALQPTQTLSFGVQNVARYRDYKVRLATATGTVFTSQDANYNSGAGATAWYPSGVWSKGDLVVESGANNRLYSCLGPSGVPFAGFTGIGGASGPTGTANFLENQVFWMYVGTGGGGSLTNDAIMNGLKSRMEYLSSPTFIASGTNQMQSSLQGSVMSKTLQLLANQPAQYFGFQVYDRGSLYGSQTQSDPGIATDLAAIKAFDNSWYGLVTAFNSSSIISAAAAWVESNTKLYPASTNDTKVATDADSVATDIAHTLKGNAYARSWAFFHPSNDEHAGAAEMGKFFAVNPGGETWRMKTLAGVTEENYTDTETTNMKAKYAHFYYDIGGRPVVGGDAKTAGGEYVDVTRFLDWYTSELQADLADLAIGVDKIPYTNAGIAMVEAKILKRNNAGIKAGGIAPDPAPIISVPEVTDILSSDKQARILRNVQTEWTLAGAIHDIRVSVTASV